MWSNESVSWKKGLCTQEKKESPFLHSRYPFENPFYSWRSRANYMNLQERRWSVKSERAVRCNVNGILVEKVSPPRAFRKLEKSFWLCGFKWIYNEGKISRIFPSPILSPILQLRFIFFIISFWFIFHFEF